MKINEFQLWTLRHYTKGFDDLICFFKNKFVYLQRKRFKTQVKPPNSSGRNRRNKDGWRERFST